MRKFSSIADPSVYVLYKMQVLRDVDSRTRPLFMVTTDDGEEFNGSTPSACWNKIYERVRKVRPSISDHEAAVETEQSFKSGSFMFCLSNPKVSKLIQEMSNSRQKSKSSQSASKITKAVLLVTYLFTLNGGTLISAMFSIWMRCMLDAMVNLSLLVALFGCATCVVLELLNFPSLLLVPYYRGCHEADHRWAVGSSCLCYMDTRLLFCSQFFSVMQKNIEVNQLICYNQKLVYLILRKWSPSMGFTEVIRVAGSYYVAYVVFLMVHVFSVQTVLVVWHIILFVHGLLFCVEPEDVDRLRFIPFDEDEEDQCIQLFSFCKKHRPLSNELLLDERIGQQACERGDYTPPSNPYGCARTEPYSSLKWRGRNEPEVLAAASSKRLYLEYSPYLVGGYSPHMRFWNKSSSALDGSKYSVDLQKLQMHQLDPSSEMLLVSDKYKFMRDTFRKRLAFGKSRIHGFGVFTKCPYRAGDMIVEYTGEIIRPSVADKRELSSYNSLVGAGTYMFRVDDERVVDATRAGSIAHLINHSCEPNCYSRTISINGNDHIIIFAKRDVKQWEELTYDYRFASKDRRLACYCGFPRCRGVVNDAESVERGKGIYVLRSEMTKLGR